MLQNGESVTYVKEQMGHHSIKITVDTYGHLIPGCLKSTWTKNRETVEVISDKWPNSTSMCNARSQSEVLRRKTGQ
jgi:hypothetical protein